MGVRLDAIDPDQAIHTLHRQKVQNIALAIAVLIVAAIAALAFVFLAYSAEPAAARMTSQVVPHSLN